MPGLVSPDPSPYWNPAEARRKAIENYLGMGEKIVEGRDYHEQPLDKFNWLAKSGQYNQQAALANMEAGNLLAGAAGLNAYNGAMTEPDDVRFRDFFRAIRGQESGGNYGAVNSDSGALGAFQIMPSNLSGPGGWDMEALGYNVTPDQFLDSRKLQNQIARYKLKQYYDKYGVKGAASTWYSGSPTRWNEQDPQGNYPSVHGYVMSILKALGLA